MNHRTRSYLLFVLLIGCICYLVSHFVVQLYFVNGSSMEPTYTSGQPVLLQKFGLPDCLDYNDVVVIRHETLGRNIVKRIVALPGDTVQITEGILYVNGVPQPTPDGFSLMEDAGNAARRFRGIPPRSRLRPAREKRSRRAPMHPPTPLAEGRRRRMARTAGAKRSRPICDKNSTYFGK